MNAPFRRANAASKAYFASLVPDDPRVEVRPMFGNAAAFVGGQMFAGVNGQNTAILSASNVAVVNSSIVLRAVPSTRSAPANPRASMQVPGFPQWRAAGLPVETGPVTIRRRPREAVS